MKMMELMKMIKKIKKIDLIKSSLSINHLHLRPALMDIPDFYDKVKQILALVAEKYKQH